MTVDCLCLSWSLTSSVTDLFLDLQLREFPGFLCRKSFGVPRPIVVRGPRERENAAKSAWYAPSPPPHTHPFAALKHHHSYLQRSRQPTYCLGAGVSGRETRANGKRHSRLPGAAVPLPPAPCPLPPGGASSSADSAHASACVRTAPLC